ncbi:TIGR03619 family F420-dependent LLM class oxidoreductase [Amycolatopsis jejuensis]|uniref:TIGR03619 family F420-dependent LLM class oxidoreductase n=1 Tax=Amycolatopsis jejuensis TaxID=330084 RepID=UPI000524BB8C|nr:TIGR03619 family F420-dependent LLM class oxidoreductase [Amycolatopsis jejuensis]
MKLGVHFYVTGYTIDPVTIARAVEEAGFESFWVPEHAVLPTNPTTPFAMTGGETPRLYGEMADPFVLLSFVAAATTELKLGTGVCIIPERHPLLLAKMIGTLDNFSRGRLLLGAGLGWMREEIELFGVDFAQRWSFTRETIEALKALWANNGTAAYEGDHVNFPEVIVDPLPAQKPHPPIVLGGLPSDRLWNRIARYGDGWIAMGAGVDDVRAARQGLTRACEQIGRDPSGIEISAGVWELDPALREAYEEAGADRLIALLYGHPGDPVPADKYYEAALQACTGKPPTPAETLSALDRIVARARL